MYVKCSNDKTCKIFKAEADVFTSLIKSGEVKVLGGKDEEPKGCLPSYVNKETMVYLQVAGVIDISKEIDRLGKKIVEIQGRKEKQAAKMNIKGYATKVPESVQATNTQKLEEMETQISEIEKSVTKL